MNIVMYYSLLVIHSCPYSCRVLEEIQAMPDKKDPKERKVPLEIKVTKDILVQTELREKLDREEIREMLVPLDLL